MGGFVAVVFLSAPGAFLVHFQYTAWMLVFFCD